MIKTISANIDVSLMVDGSGLNLYLGDNDTPSIIYSHMDLVERFLEGIVSDEDGKVYEELSYELDDVIGNFRMCLAMLEDAKR